MSDPRTEVECKTTGEVLARLHRLGLLHVTSAMIENDTASHYLPKRETAHRGRGGASGLWEPWMERRAERLYRLRALDRRTGHGPSGLVLRLFLFFADGWGWEHVKETCVQGYRLSIRAAMQGVKNRVRGRPLTLENLHAVADDIAQEQYKGKEPTQDQIDRVKMTIGVFAFGAAPDGKMGTLERITADLVPDAEPGTLAELKQFGPLLWTMLGASESEAIEILEGEHSPQHIRQALRNAHDLRRRARAMFRDKFAGDLHDERPSFNPLTFFGAASDPRFQKALRVRRMPFRATPAQLLGSQFAHSLVIVHQEEQLRKLTGFWVKWLALWLQSDNCAQWIRQMESEISKQQQVPPARW